MSSMNMKGATSENLKPPTQSENRRKSKVLSKGISQNISIHNFKIDQIT